MEKGTTYVALDDSKRKIVAGILRPGATAPELCEIANEPRHIRRLFEPLKREEGAAVAACYEAGVSGYDLYRQITAFGVASDVIAPALTPRRPGQRIKTDRRDAAAIVTTSAATFSAGGIACSSFWAGMGGSISPGRTGVGATGCGSAASTSSCRRCSARPRRRGCRRPTAAICPRSPGIMRCHRNLSR